MPRQNYLDIGKISVASRKSSTRKTSALPMETSRRLENAPPACGRVGWGVSGLRSFRAARYQVRNLIRSRKSAAADFFLYVPRRGTYRIAKRYIVSAGYIAPKAYRVPTAPKTVFGILFFRSSSLKIAPPACGRGWGGQSAPA